VTIDLISIEHLEPIYLPIYLFGNLARSRYMAFRQPTRYFPSRILPSANCFG